MIPLSPAQRRLWFLNRLEGSAPTYNIALVLRLAGVVDVPALQAAVNDVVARHEALRTRFPETDDVPRQDIVDAAEGLVALRVVDTDEAGLPGSVAEASELGFDLLTELPVRGWLFRLDTRRCVLLLVFHHIAVDGWSVGPLGEDLGFAYGARAAGRAPDWEPLPVQYADYTLWQREVLGSPDDPESVVAQALEYWRGALAALPDELNLPVDRPRSAVPNHRGGTVELGIPAAVHAGLATLADDAGATLFMVVHAAVAVLLTRLGAGEDIPLGTVVAGREDEALNRLVGFFVNTLVLRTDTSGDPTFRELLARVRETDLAAYSHQDVPFDTLVEVLNPARAHNRHPLFQTAVILQSNAAATYALPGLTVEAQTPPVLGAVYDLTFTFSEGGSAEPGGLDLSVEYRADLFDADTARVFARCLAELLEQFAQDPACTVHGARMVGPAEYHRMLESWNSTAHPLPERTLAEILQEQARRTPQATAVEYGGRVLTYRELDDLGRILARDLTAAHGPGAVVAIATGSTPELVIAMVGAIKAGCPFVVLDPRSPDDRLAAIIADSAARVLLTRRPLLPGLDGLAGGMPTLCLDDAHASGAVGAVGAAAEARPARPGPADAVCLFYTSGSTGRPKGVVFVHRPLVNYTLTMVDAFGLGVGDRILQVASVGFDVLLEEVLPTLASGGAVVLTEEPVLVGGADLAGCIERLGVTGLELTTAYWHEWVDDLVSTGRALPSCLRFVAMGGERIIPERLEQWRKLGVDLIHVYGLTEATCTSTVWRVEAGAQEADTAGTADTAVPPIGRPLWNTRAYVLDSALRVVPERVGGELYIGGDVLARGYTGRPDLTAERFVADPFGPPGSRMYRTGDLVRRRSDGALEFVARADAQVKIRGFRVEPAEVEAVLARDPEIAGITVAVRTDHGGTKQLIAYVVPAAGSSPEPVSLRARAVGALPDYMVPAAFVLLDRLPLTPNGKVDRGALPEPPEAERTAGREPRSGLESELCALFAEVLAVPGVGVDDDFFELGGHSLLAVRLINRIRATFGVELGIHLLFAAPTVSRLAAAFPQSSAMLPTRTPLRAAERPAVLPLSAAQRGLWFINRLEGSAPTYNVPLILRLSGDVDVTALQAAVNDVVARHEILRTVFPEVDEAPCQRIVEPREDLVALRLVSSADGTVLPGLLAEASEQGFDLRSDLPVRGWLFQLDDGQCVLLLVLHHIVVDGWSLDPLSSDLGVAYGARAAGRAPEWDPLPVQYADYTVWQRTTMGDLDDPESAIAGALEYWRDALRDLPDELRLPADRSRPPVSGHRGYVVESRIGSEPHTRLSTLARESGATLFMVLHAAVAALLTRLGAGEDIPLGTVVAGRDDEALNELVGYFANTLVLRTDTSGDPTFRGLLARVRETDLAAYAHQYVPFDTLVEALNPNRAHNGHPLFQTLFALEDAATASFGIPGLQTEQIRPEWLFTKFDLTVHAVEHRHDDGSPGGIGFAVEFAADLFDRRTAEAVVARLVRLLEAAAVDPDVRIGNIEVLSAVERRELLVDWNDTACPETAWSVPELFAVQVARVPDAVAVECADRVLTYRELDEASEGLAGVLAGAGVGPESAVAVLLQRGVDVVVASLAILKAGGAYVPLALDGSVERSGSVLSGVGARVLLVEAATCAHPVVAHAVDDGIRIIRVDAADAPEPSGTAAGTVTSATSLPSVHPDQLAYVIHTSGSSGVPKGVGISHRSVAAHVFDTCWDAVPGAEAGEAPVLLMHAPHAFDPSTYEMWVPLLRGGRVVAAEPGPVDIAAFGALIRGRGVNAVCMVPLLFNAMVEEALEDLGGLRLAWTAGDVVSGAAIERLLDRYPEMMVASAWGTTETTVISSWQPLEPPYKAAGPVTAGRVMDNTRIYVLDDRLSLVPAGVAGEAYVGGSGLARGYASRPDLTAERFVADPFGPPGSRMYRTGDVMRWRPDGSLDFVGRADAQVKIRGFRVEPAEVEAVLARDSAIAQAAVIVHGRAGTQRLTAYVVLVAEARQAVDAEALRSRIAEVLPDYMVPAAFVTLDALPMTPNGKVDRRALPEPPPVLAAGSGRAPANAREEQLCGLFAELLGLPAVGPDDTFFELGGHSLLATRLANRIRTAMGVELQVRELFEHPSPALLAARLDRAGAARPSDARPALVSRSRPRVRGTR